MKKKAIIFLLCAGLSFGILTGCGSEESAASEDTEQGSETVNGEEAESVGEEEGRETAEADSSGQKEPSDETERADYLVREVKKASGWSEKIEYDADGKILEHIYYDQDGNVSEWQEYEYDEHSNMVHRAYFTGDSEEPTRSEEYENEYDADNKLIGRISRLADGTVESRAEYEYDSAGNRVKEIIYSGDDEVFEEIEYDASGNIIKDLGPDGGAMYEYDTFGNPAAVITLDENGNAGRETKYNNVYDDAGNLVKWTAYFAEGGQWAENEYDEYGNLVKTTYYLENEDVPTMVCEYEYSAD